MARRATITDERILEAARQVFLEKGIVATTAEVARRARIAEGSIFNHFKSKQELFRAAMQLELDEPAFLKTLGERVGRGDVRENLIALGLRIIDFLRTVLPLMMMSWSNQNPCGLPDALAEPNSAPLRALKRLAGFFEAEIRAGRLRRHDAEILARVFLGAMQNYVFFELLLKAHDELPLPAETYVRGLVQLLWRGARPRGKEG